MEAESKFDMSEQVENWAPPPPVVFPQGVPQQQPPSVDKDDELEFESTLNTLVDHFNSLPPPAFGEPPELPELTSRLEGTRDETTTTKNHSVMWMVACSLVLGGVLAGGGIFALNYGVFGAVIPVETAAVEQPAPEIAIPEVKVIAPAATAPLEEKAEPHTEPLNEMKAKVASVGGAPVSKPIIEEGEEAGKVVKAQPKRATRVKRQVKRVRKHRQNVKRTRASVTPKTKAAPVAASSGEWEDPYK